MRTLPATVLGPTAAAAAIKAGADRVFCAMPDDYLDLDRRKVAWMYLHRALVNVGAEARIWWAWYREFEDGEKETVFLLQSGSGGAGA